VNPAEQLRLDEEMEDEQRRRRLDSLSDEERILLYVPPGYRFAFIAAALTKRALATDDIKVGDRLHLLEKLNGLTDRYLTADMLAMMEPMSNLEFEIFPRGALTRRRRRQEWQRKL